MDLQIDDFYKDAASGLLALYQVFPRKAALYVEDLIGREEPDEFGLPSEISGYGLAATVELKFLEDGDHDLKPRKSISGFSAADHIKTMAQTVRDWSSRIEG